jgi:hypothetical protein
VSSDLVRDTFLLVQTHQKKKMHLSDAEWRASRPRQKIKEAKIADERVFFTSTAAD